ncbi:MAG TPA: thermonuclease family protein [Bacteriovoracaceae bacterium]|nr:thermonuclease family protein [Bacteriovoracaceae bacterium]
MKTLIVLLFFSFGVSAQKDCDHTRQRFSCVKFIRNYDGDTLTFDLPGVHSFFGEGAKVRVKGIDTPELKPRGEAAPCETEWGRVAKKLVEAELKTAKVIHLTGLSGLDKYGRILAQVEYDGKNLSDVLLKNKLAVPYVGKKKIKVNWCDQKNKREKGHGTKAI